MNAPALPGIFVSEQTGELVRTGCGGTNDFTFPNIFSKKI